MRRSLQARRASQIESLQPSEVLAVRKVQRKPIRRQETKYVSANSFLVFIAAVLVLILAIVEADLHRDVLKSMGIVFESEHLDERFVGL